MLSQLTCKLGPVESNCLVQMFLLYAVAERMLLDLDLEIAESEVLVHPVQSNVPCILN